MKDVVAKIAHLYPDVYHRLHARWYPSEYRPSPESLAILHYLNWTGPQSVGELAERFHRAQSVMSEIIDRLAKRGVIKRSPDGRDRRRTLIWLSEEGEKLLERTRQVLDPESLEQCVSAMSDHEQQQLINGLEALVREADKLVGKRRKNHE